MTKNERLRLSREKIGMSQAKLAKSLEPPVTQPYIAGLEAGKNFSLDQAKDIAKVLNVDFNWLYFGDDSPKVNFHEEELSSFVARVPAPGEENEMIPLGNNEFGLTVKVVPVNAHAGYADNFGDNEFYDSLGKRTLTVMGNFRGHYLAFVVKGDSMENWTSEEMAKDSIPAGSIVTGREIQKHHWKNKLHLHRFQDYIIVHRDGVITKRITEHNTDEGYIVCHSLNPKYKDVKLMLDDCLQILNIVDVSRPR